MFRFVPVLEITGTVFVLVNNIEFKYVLNRKKQIKLKQKPNAKGANQNQNML